jgi:hypothetical protein
MNRIQLIQQAIGAEPDGFWGPKSIKAAQKHLLAMMPKPSQWPKSDQVSLTRFYGMPGDESKHTQINVTGLGVKYGGKEVTKITCHEKVAASLKRVLVALSHEFPEILARYDGCYNNRNMRGGNSPSLHARAAAIDFDADHNGNHTSWPVVATMPLGVMEIFAREGWTPAGAFWGRDAMHFQATQ